MATKKAVTPPKQASFFERAKPLMVALDIWVCWNSGEEYPDSGPWCASCNDKLYFADDAEGAVLKAIQASTETFAQNLSEACTEYRKVISNQDGKRLAAAENLLELACLYVDASNIGRI